MKKNLEMLISDLESLIDEKTNSLEEFLSAPPVNYACEKAQLALETAYLAEKSGIDTEYAKIALIQAIKSFGSPYGIANAAEALKD